MAKQTFNAEVDVTLPEVGIEIGGRERPLCFDMAAISRVERSTGLNLFDAVLEAPGAVGTTSILYAALLHDDPGLTYEEVQGWVKPQNRFEVLKAVRAAWLGSIPEPEDAAEGEAEPQAQS